MNFEEFISKEMQGCVKNITFVFQRPFTERIKSLTNSHSINKIK